MIETESTKVTTPTPGFAIDYGGKLYMTLGVLEYDPNHPNKTPEQEETIKRLQQAIDKGPRLTAARVVQGWHTYAAGITNPPEGSNE